MYHTIGGKVMDQKDDVKEIKVETREQAIDLVFQNFMHNVSWFALGVKSTDNEQAARYLIQRFLEKLDSFSSHSQSREGKPLC
jgi:hypothetical protein